MRPIPLTIAGALADTSWRADPVWPSPLSATRERLRAMSHAIGAASGTGNDGVDAIVALAGIPVGSRLGATLDHAALVAAGRDASLAFAEVPPPASTDRRVDKPSHAALRALVRTATLNGPRGLVEALLSPRGTIVAHNALTRDVARRGRGGLGFRHAGDILAEARAIGAKANPDEVEAASEKLLDAVATIGVPDESDVAFIRHAVETAASDLAGLAAARGAGGDVWIATGGAPASRAVALDARRRGARVTGFDHGGCTGMFLWNEALAFGEFRVLDRFVTMTEHTAEATRAITPIDILGHDGDRSFQEVAALPSRGRHARPKVLWPLGPFYGFRQWFPPLLPDAVYLVFLDRVARALSGVDVVAKPRPGGIRPHPIEAMVPARHEPFEDVLGEFDVVIFDDVHSSTFWKTLQTDRGVVLLDLGLNRFSPVVAGLIAERVVVVPVNEDRSNIPAIDTDMLRTAIDRAASQAWDGRAFTRLFSWPTHPGRALAA